MTATTKKKKKSPAYAWDDRGICVVSLRVGWTAWASGPAWGELVRGMGMELADETEAGPDPEAATFPDATLVATTALRQVDKSHVVIVSAHDATEEERSGKSSKKGIPAHWMFEVWRAPPNPPPDRLKVVPFSEALSKIELMWPKRPMTKFTATASYVVDGARYSLNKAVEQDLRLPPVTIGKGTQKQTLVKDATVWRINRDKGNASYVTVSHRRPDNSFALLWSGDIQCRLDGSLLETLEGMVWEALGSIVCKVH